MRFTEQMVVDEIRRLTLRELRLWVRQGWVRPALAEAGPLFDDIDVARLRLLCDLRKEMALPANALPVVLTLIDSLHRTRRDLHALMGALADQPEDVRRAVSTRLQVHATGKTPRNDT